MVPQKEFANEVEDVMVDAIYDMLVKLITEFDKKGYVTVSPMVENSTDWEEATFEAAENLKESVLKELEGLGLSVEGDGKEF